MSKENDKRKEDSIVISPVDLAARWNCSRQNIYNMIDSGQLKGFKIGNRNRILLSEVNRIEGGQDESI